jgi:hypothetical protein
MTAFTILYDDLRQSKNKECLLPKKNINSSLCKYACITQPQETSLVFL